MKKPKHTVKVRSEDIKTGEDGTITITQGTRTYPAQARVIAGEEYFIVESPLTGKKVWIQARFEG
jgi:hypothetical protein